MHPIKKFLILVIVLVAILIIYNLLKSRQIIKINYEKEKKDLKEGFASASAVSIAAIPQSYLQLPIREFIIKSSYNSAINLSCGVTEFPWRYLRFILSCA